jgi:kinesin family protein 5
MLMSDSLGGNAKTLMFVCCSPADYNREESACALEFAKRCKDVKNNISGGRKDLTSEVRSLRAEIARLKKERDNDPSK